MPPCIRVIHSPFGYALRAARDSATRADAIGLDVMRLRWAAFTLAGAAAGLGGGLYAFSKGSIDPTLLSIPQSVDFLAMILTGGIQAVTGALAGAGVFHLIKDMVMPLTQYWRALLGCRDHRHRAAVSHTASRARQSGCWLGNRRPRVVLTSVDPLHA